MVRCAKINNFQIFLLIAIEMAILSVFLQKKGLGSLGVNGKGLPKHPTKLNSFST